MRKRTVSGVLTSAVAAMFAAVFLIAAPSGPSRAADFVVEPLDYDFPAEVEAAAEEGKTIVVMFIQNGCPYCDKMHKRVFPHPQVNAYYSEHFKLIEVNNKGSLDVVSHDGEPMNEKDYTEKMRVRATPVFLFLSKDSKEALKLTGYQDVNMFLAAGRYVATEAFADGTSFLSFVRAGR